MVQLRDHHTEVLQGFRALGGSTRVGKALALEEGMNKLSLLLALAASLAIGCTAEIGELDQRVECYDTANGVQCVPDDGSDEPVDLDGDGEEDTYLCSDVEDDDDLDGDGIEDDEFIWALARGCTAPVVAKELLPWSTGAVLSAVRRSFDGELPSSVMLKRPR